MMLRALQGFCRRHSTGVTIAGALLVVAALAVALAGDYGEFVRAFRAAPVWSLAAAGVLQLVWLAVRSETWGACVSSAGGNVARRRLYPAAAVGYLGNLLNGQFGLAARIAALRRADPHASPPASVLLTSEVPIVVVEVALAALMSFTLIGPLGLPWWFPIAGLSAVVLVGAALRAVARNRREGAWRGLAALRGMHGRNRVVALVVLAVCLQIARNWFVLNGVGVEASVFDATALLIAIAALGVLPVGPTVGAASAAIVFGTDTGAAAAAGALLTATAAGAALAFAALGLAMGLRKAQPSPAVALP